jgi:Mce-associated membrane protein
MAEAKESRADSPESTADQMALIEEAEAEAAEAEALAAAAAARARAARLRRQALVATEAEEAGETPTATETQATEETEETEDDEDDEDDYEDAPLWRRWMPSLSTIGKAAAILLICAFVALSALMVSHHRESAQRQERVAKFVAGARQGIVYMTSMNFSRAKEDVQRLLDSTTGQFKDDFAQGTFTKAVEQSKVVTEGTVTAAAVESMDNHSAQVLVSATSHTVHSADGKDETKPWRFRVTVTEEGGQYKMSKVEFVP